MYSNIDFDIDRADSFVYSQEYTPDIEDFDINDYESEDDMKEDMLRSYTFYIENVYDSYGNPLIDRGFEVDCDDVEKIFGSEILQMMINNDGINRGGNTKEITIGVNTTPKSLSLKDVGDVAKKVMPTTEYFKGCRGFILYDGTIVETEAEHSMCAIIDGIKSTFHFIEIGNIRILNQSIDLAKEPTQQQRRVLTQVINSYSDTDLYLDIMDGNNIGVHYYCPDYRKVLADIDRYFGNGIKPQVNQINESSDNDEETTFYAFYSNIRAFLSSLLKNPLSAEPSEYLKKRGFTKARLIKLLLLKDVISKKENIVIIPDDNGKKHAEHQTKFGVKRENFERKIKRIYIQFFEKNLPEPKKILTENEEKNTLFKRIKEFYGGSTQNFDSIRGFIFPDGEVVNVQNKMHEDIRIPSGGMGLGQIYSMGIIRLEYNGIALATALTLQQKQTLRKIIINHNKFFVDFYGKEWWHCIYENCNVDTVNLLNNHIIRFMEEGIKPDRIVDCNMLNEDECGGATSADACNSTAPIIPLGSEVIMRPSILAGKSGKKDKKNDYDPTEINGKTLTAENTKQRHFYFTEEQIKRFSEKKNFE